MDKLDGQYERDTENESAVPLNTHTRCPIPQTPWMGNVLKRQWCHAVDQYDEGLNVIQLEWYTQHW